MSEDGELLRTAYEARDRQLAELRAEVADLVARAELAEADAASHEREAGAQRERAERAEREAILQRDRADALDVRLRKGLLGRLRR